MQLPNAFRDRIETKSDGSANATIDPDCAYELLANNQRGHIVEHLVTHDDDTVALRKIADYLADVMVDDRRTHYISVLQQHAPRMESAGVVMHDNQPQALQVHPSLHTVYEAREQFRGKPV